MKKLIFNKLNFLLVILSILIWTSCKTDRISPVTESTKDLTGTWKIISATRNGTNLLPLVDTSDINFNNFNLVFSGANYSLTSSLPFIVSQSGTFALDNPQYPFQISFKPTGAATPTSTAFTYPIVNGVRVLTIVFSPGCTQNSYSYSFEKVK
ncbi:DUF5004 domain-containing protein [Mucilaginibacter sp. E4BP6]|jgi:hypothetical protein|uniref:DUF5004 domain-containing protein n=1 Tax=Mucilaginibacter sp. E4BP6 TaxID=2723089 RepID=UPI0015CC2D71|nr:DUF5004 domain-containing protein [Mucilaginibacter sp. E4BP6]NYE66881.1 hypothetical protein [Mucilaginibacter sp. E4BP6]